MYWEAVSTDAWGHIQDENFGNGVATFTAFDPASGLMSYREGGVGGGTGLIHSMVDWDLNGNLKQRQDLKLSPAVTEDFYYDALNRFDYSNRTAGGSPAINADVTLDAIGNISWKMGVGSYTYHATKKRAVTLAGSFAFDYDANGNMTSRNGSSISYTSYNLPSVINAGAGTSSTLSYGAFRNRYKQIAVTSTTTETTIYVAGLLEKVTWGSTIEYRHLIHGGKGAAAIHTRVVGGASSTYYLHRDHLGSPELITDSSGNEVVRPSFGAYGERRDGTDWSGPPSTADLTDIANTSRRGFTGHEHLDAVGLIHMNGRVYEPVAGRFLSRDPFIDGVASSQGVNGYAYAHNNPPSLVDPSGFYCEPPEGMSEEEASIYVSRCNDEYDAGGWGSIAQNERWCAMLDIGCQQANWQQTLASLAEYLSTCNCEQALMEMLQRGRITFTNYLPRGTGYIECGAPGQFDCGEYEPPSLRWDVAAMLYVQGNSPDVRVRANSIGLPSSLPTSAFSSNDRAVIFSLDPTQFIVHGSVTIERRGDEYFVLGGTFDFLPHEVTSPWEAVRNVSAFLGEAAAGPGIPFMIQYFGPAGSVRADYREMFPHPVPRWQ